jgi:DNA polymerase-3 subunit delta'
VIAELQAETWRRLAAMPERAPHALLFCGPAGVGKLALAERFAQRLLCERPGQGSAPCGACDGCRWFLGGNHPDARYVEPEAIARRAALEDEGEQGGPKAAKPSTEIKVEQVRALADFVNIGSHRGGWRVAIIHPAEDMNAHAANSLLKSLEEPPPGAVFLLVSHRPARLPPTVRSRCVPVPVPVPEPRAARAWLEARGVREAGRWLAFAGGAPRLALEYASGERGAALERLLEALKAPDAAVLAAVNEREDLELLAEILQKLALDQAFASVTGRGRYLPQVAAGNAPDSRAWLRFARDMGRNRALARHPLNVKLFASEMLAGMPRPEG